MSKVRKEPITVFDFALEARIALARFRVLAQADEEYNAIDYAARCGYCEYPGTLTSAFIVREPLLVAAWRHGWSQREEKLRLLTEAELRFRIETIASDADHGRWQDYVSYTQEFTGTINTWLPQLREEERTMALKLLKSHAYCPNLKETAFVG